MRVRVFSDSRHRLRGGVGRRAFGTQASRRRALAAGRSGAEPSVPTLAAQTVLRVREGRPLTRPVYLFGLRPLHLCGTRLEGGHRRLSRTLRFVWVEPKRAAASSAGTPTHQHRRRRRRRREDGVRQPGTRHRVPATASASPGCSGSGRGRRRHHANGSPSTQPYRRERPWCPPSRRVPHKWSGRRPNRYMGRVSGLPFRTRRTV